MAMANQDGTGSAVAASRRACARWLLTACLLVAFNAPVQAQGFDWPWSESDDEPEPQPREPVYRAPPEQGPPPPPPQGPPQQGPPGPAGQQGAGAQPGGAWGTKNPICLQLEQRLVQEGQRGNQSQNVLPQIEAEMRQVGDAVRRDGDQLERRCYEYFLFSKTLRGTPQCRDLARAVDAGKRRLAELDARRQGMSTGRSYQDDIISELARNNCGSTYQQQARRREGNGWGQSFWDNESEGGSGGGGLGTYGNLGYATYRTLCVRLCDGYYFPISFSTLPNHFQRDQEACQSKCAAPVELYYYQNPGGAIDQMVAVNSSEAYTKLGTAFRYRKEYVKGCSCKQAEYVAPGTAGPQSTPGNPAAPPAKQQGASAPAGGAAPAAGNAAPATTGSAAPPAPTGARAQAPDAGGWDAQAQ
jgi:hypothetical protein